MRPAIGPVPAARPIDFLTGLGSAADPDTRSRLPMIADGRDSSPSREHVKTSLSNLNLADPHGPEHIGEIIARLRG